MHTSNDDTYVPIPVNSPPQELPSNSTKNGNNRFGATLSLLTAVVGGGLSMISTPIAVRYLGIYVFIFFEALFGILSATALYITIDMGTQLNVYSLDKLMPISKQTNTNTDLISKPPSPIINYKCCNKILSLIIVSGIFAAIIAFLDTIKDVLHDMLTAYNISTITSDIITITLIIILFLLCLLDNVKQIEYLSLIATCLCITFLIILFVNFIFLFKESKLATKHENTNSNDVIDYLRGIPAILLNWSSQFLILPVIKPVIHNTPDLAIRLQHARHVLIGMTIPAFILFVSEGIIAYLCFNRIESDITNNINPNGKNTNDHVNLGISSGVARIGICCLALGAYLTIPLFFIEMRHMFLRLINYNYSINKNGKNSSIFAKVASTCLLLFSAIGLVLIFGDTIDIVIEFIGTIGANTISWLFPSSLYFVNLKRLKSCIWKRVVSCVCLVIYVVILIGGLITFFV